VRAGVRVVASSDAPYGNVDPWVTIHDAANRTVNGHVLLPDERIDAGTALASMLTSPAHPGHVQRTIAPGAPADLCLLHGPLAATLQAVTSSPRNPVRATFIDGDCVYVSSSA
jgi:predicted amidohydrolase YtcJ